MNIRCSEQKYSVSMARESSFWRYLVEDLRVYTEQMLGEDIERMHVEMTNIPKNSILKWPRQPGYSKRNSHIILKCGLGACF